MTTSSSDSPSSTFGATGRIASSDGKVEWPAESPVRENMLHDSQPSSATPWVTGSIHSRSSNTVLKAIPCTRARPPTGNVHGTTNQSLAKISANSISINLPTSVVSGATSPKLVRRSSNAHQRVFGIPSKTTWVGMNVWTLRVGATTGPTLAGSSRVSPLCSSAYQSRLPW